MTDIFVVVGIILFVGLFICLIFLPSRIARTKTSATLGWTIATLATGVIPGIVAALLLRDKVGSPPPGNKGR